MSKMQQRKANGAVLLPTGQPLPKPNATKPFRKGF